MSPNAARKVALEWIEAVEFPEGWKMAQPDETFRFQRHWWRENSRKEGERRHLSGVHLSAMIRGGSIEVSGFGMMIVCGGLQVQAAVDAVLAWEVTSREAEEQYQRDTQQEQVCGSD